MATCNSVDSVLEAAALIKANGKKLNDFVNGTAVQTVQLGTGAPTPTLRKFIADAQDVVTQAALDAGQTVLDDVAQNIQDIEDLQSSKADKVVGAIPGNLARLDASGNLRDAGHAAEDFTLLLAYTNNEAIELAWQNRMAIARYEDWLDVEADRSRRDMDIIASANLVSMQTRQNIRDLIDAFDESYAQHRLMQRLFDGTNPASSSKPVLFVISGQSNASGGGKYKPFERAVDCGQFWEWYDYPNWTSLAPEEQSLKPLTDPIGQGYYGSGCVPFARKFFQYTGRKVILLNIASGGSFVTDGGYTTENTWADNGYGTLRASRQAIWNAFSAAVPASSYDLGGILWLQGESEVGRLWAGRITMQDYIDGTIDVWSWMRTLIGGQNCSVFVGKIAYTLSSIGDSSIMNIFKDVQEQQEMFCDYATVFPGFFATPDFKNCIDLYYSDTAHYSAYGYKMVGEGFARSVAHYLNF